MKKLNDYSFKTKTSNLDIQRIFDENEGRDFVTVNAGIDFIFPNRNNGINEIVLISDTLRDQLENNLKREEIAEVLGLVNYYSVPISYGTFHFSRLNNCITLQAGFSNGSIKLEGCSVFAFDEDDLLKLYEFMCKKINTKHRVEVQAFKLDDLN